MEEKDVDVVALFDRLEYELIEESDRIVDERAEALKAEFEKEGGMLTPEQSLERFRHTMHDAVKGLRDVAKRMNDAMNAIGNNAKHYLTKEELQQCAEALKKFQDIETKPMKAEELEGKTIQEALGVPDPLLYYFYVIGYNLFNHKNYKESSDIFFFLNILNPLVRDYWIASGTAEKLQGHHEEAVQAFVVASIMDEKDPIPRLSAAECYIALRDAVHAQEILAEAKEIAKNHPEQFAQFQPQIQQLESTIKNLRNVA